MNDDRHLERVSILLEGIELARSLSTKYDYFPDRVIF